jgi:hypothetical protein
VVSGPWSVVRSPAHPGTGVNVGLLNCLDLGRPGWRGGRIGGDGCSIAGRGGA